MRKDQFREAETKLEFLRSEKKCADKQTEIRETAFKIDFWSTVSNVEVLIVHMTSSSSLIPPVPADGGCGGNGHLKLKPDQYMCVIIFTKKVSSAFKSAQRKAIKPIMIFKN